VENQGGKNNGFYSRKLKAGKRRTYFFDVRDTKQGDFYLTITESKKKFDGDGYESHKIFLYKEDFKKFMEALNDTVNHVKTELMPDFDYDADRFIPTQESNSNYYQQSERNTQKHHRLKIQLQIIFLPEPSAMMRKLSGKFSIQLLSNPIFL
jgi:hypothetical protein